MPWLRLVLAAVVAYLIGSIPVGYFVIWLTQGKDIRTVGSGRTGGTNAITRADRGQVSRRVPATY